METAQHQHNKRWSTVNVLRRLFSIFLWATVAVVRRSFTDKDAGSESDSLHQQLLHLTGRNLPEFLHSDATASDSSFHGHDSERKRIVRAVKRLWAFGCLPDTMQWDSLWLLSTCLKEAFLHLCMFAITHKHFTSAALVICSSSSTNKSVKTLFFLYTSLWHEWIQLELFKVQSHNI